MSAPQSNGNKTRAWLQELKSNRKTQAALAMFVLVVGYLGYELFAPKGSGSSNKRVNAPRNVIGQPLEVTQTAALQKLPNLAGLHKAGELPSESRMFRDLFLFDSPPPPPKAVAPQPKVEAPPKPPPTPEELAAAARQAAIDREVRAQPSDYKFIAIVHGRTSPVQGVFQKGDDIHFFKIGDEITPNWQLAAIKDKEEAQFQNTKFQELKFTIKAQLGASGQTSGQQPQVTNYF
ncbi:MAG: hypothetical protein LBQ86_08295 [Holophagales bacterium]|jgi:hypothetical protein|nr:hypothetical protein [Holophagales bacterium]